MSDETVVAAPAAPVAPAPTPAVSAEPKFHVKDSGRDVLGDVLNSSKQGRYFDQDSSQFKQHVPVEYLPTSTESSAPISTATGTTAPVSTSTAPLSTSTTPSVDPNAGGETRLYAGKFKTVEEMEAGYTEAQKAFHTKSQELAEAKKATPSPDPKVIAEKTAEEKAAMLNRIIEDPDSIVREIETRTQAAIKQQNEIDAIRTNWRKENADIAEHESYVGYEAARLFALDPSLETAAMLTQATTNFRAMHGKIRESGKHEALQVRSSVTPLSESRIQTPPPTEHPVKAPVTQEQATQSHLDFLKAEAARVRRR